MLAVESARLTGFNAMPWENKLMVTPGWKMFADGGVVAGGEWRVIINTPRERIDATDIARQALPHLWRDRFYINIIFNDLVNRNTGPGSLVDRLGRATKKMYRERQLRLGLSPNIANVGFEIYQWEPPPGTPRPSAPRSYRRRRPSDRSHGPVHGPIGRPRPSARSFASQSHVRASRVGARAS